MGPNWTRSSKRSTRSRSDSFSLMRASRNSESSVSPEPEVRPTNSGKALSSASWSSARAGPGRVFTKLRKCRTSLLLPMPRGSRSSGRKRERLLLRSAAFPAIDPAITRRVPSSRSRWSLIRGMSIMSARPSLRRPSGVQVPRSLSRLSRRSLSSAVSSETGATGGNCQRSACAIALRSRLAISGSVVMPMASSTRASISFPTSSGRPRPLMSVRSRSRRLLSSRGTYSTCRSGRDCRNWA